MTEDRVTRRVSGLSETKRAYLERLLEAGAPRLAPRPDPGPAPLSFAQERLWFLHQLEAESTAYTVFHALRFDALDLAALERAVDALVARHEVLRTRFVIQDDGPVQVVEPALHVAVEDQDLRGRPDPLAAARSLAEGVARTRFDLTRAPLLRVVAGRLGEADWAVLLALHHIVIDGWSMSVLLGELRELYAAASGAVMPSLAPLPVQYADHAVWQRRALRGPRLEALLAYWREALRDASPLALSTDRPRPPVQSHEGAVERLVVDPATAAGLRALAQDEGASLFMCLLAVHGVVLSRWTGQDDVLVGAPTAGRGRAELEHLIGFFVNTLVLRLRLEGDPSFRELLRRVRRLALDAYAHEDLPFERLVQDLAPDRDPRGNPLVQTTFQLLEGRERESATSGFLAVERPAVAFDLQVDVSAAGPGLAVRFAYATDLFDADTVARMAGHYTAVASAVVANPDAPISMLALLTQAEREELAAWNRTAAPVSDVLVHTLVEAQARQTPDAVAVEDGATLTYGALDTRADGLARHLAALGAGPDRAVALLLPRGADLAVAQLGVLKAGAAYLPLDVATPKLRLAAVLAQARPLAVLTRVAHATALPADAPPVVLLDRPLPPAAAAPVEAAPDHLAYLIATSGTTGTPKLVSVEHRSLVNLIEWHRDAYGVTNGDRAPLVAAVSFDASVWETWPYLAAGATLVVPDDPTRRSPRDLLAWLARERITLAFLPTPLAEAVLAEEPPAGLRLRALLTGGDVLHAPPPRPLPFVLVNHYGPTECAVVAAATPVTAEDPAGVPPPIGAPIRNVEAHVLDARGRPQPVGVPGELHLAGIALARGYFGDPEATRTAFGPHSHSPDRRLYRTGDRVVRLTDGRLRFLGRLDQQLKVRGIRVEAGDLVAQLRSHPEVREAAVTVHGDVLAAYVVARDGIPPAPANLRAHLAERLPAALVPVSFTVIDELPLTTHGKVDVSALPAPAETVGAGVSSETTPTEASVAAIFAELLGASGIGPDDDFFDLGGHSLLATRLVSRVRASLGVEVAVRSVFEAGSVRNLAAAIDAARAAGAVDDLPALRPAARRRYRATVDADGGLRLTDELRATLLGAVQAEAEAETTDPGERGA